MDRSWFDRDDLGLDLGRRWGASSAGHQSSLLEMELHASSLRLRETARLAVTGHTGFAARRTGLAHRINTIMRVTDESWVVDWIRDNSQSTGDEGKCSQAGDYDEMNKNLRTIKEENLKLKAVINDVTEVNKRWQKYNNDRQIYVQRLLTTIQDQQDQINKMVANRAFTTLPVVEDAETSSLQDAVLRLQRQIDQLGLEHGETVQVLKFQVKAHHDDWEAERREKQQALQDKLAAEAKIRQLQKELRAHKLKPREDRLETESRCGCRCCHTCETGLEPVTSRLDHCRSDNAKTYRTSVHVPCNAGHLLSRGTTLSFDADLATDGDTSRSSPERCPTPPDIPSSTPAVRMGFSHTGLASVSSFSQTPIVKSCSLPNPASPSYPDSFAVSAESLFPPPNKPSLPGAGHATSTGPSRPDSFAVSAESLFPPPRKPSLPEAAWKPKYFQDGVDTQTREDIICPVCDMLFPPTSHVKFLDHFGKCQNDAMTQKL